MFCEQFKFILLFIVLPFDLPSLACYTDSARFVFYYGPTYNDHQSYDLDKVASILDHPKFIHNQTNCFIHGYNGSQEAYSTHLLVDAYLKRNSINLVTIDWEALSNGTYISAQQNLLELTPRVANSIQKLFDAGLDVDSFSLVGHSLGGLGVGIIARELFKKSNGKVFLPRITALDPSNAAAYDVFVVPPLETSDAKFIDVIHTDAGESGSSVFMGHADFWPNGGEPIQPGCPIAGVNDKCSHRKAWAYWAETVATVYREVFWAYPAESYDEFLQHQLNGAPVPMGLHCPTSVRGNYYLRINSTYGAIPDVGLDS